MKPSIPVTAFLQALGVVAYISLLTLIVYLLENGIVPAPEIEFIGPMILLLTFVISAAITGGLVLGYPIILFLEKRKRDALILFFETIGFLVLFLGIAITYIALR